MSMFSLFAHKRIQEVESEMQAMLSRLDLLEQRVDTERETNRTLTAKLSSERAKSASLECQVNSQRHIIETLENEAKDLQSTIDAMLIYEGPADPQGKCPDCGTVACWDGKECHAPGPCCKGECCKDGRGMEIVEPDCEAMVYPRVASSEETVSIINRIAKQLKVLTGAKQ